MVHEISAGTIIEHNDHILVIQSIVGDWGFPKGHLDDDETPEQAAEREAYEEVGLRVTIGKYIGKVAFTLKNGNTKEVLYFLATAADGNVRMNHKGESVELKDFQWCSKEQAAERLSFDDLRELFRDAYPSRN